MYKKVPLREILRDMPESAFKNLSPNVTETITKVVNTFCDTFGVECCTGKVLGEIFTTKGVFKGHELDQDFLLEAAAFATKVKAMWKAKHK